MIFNFDEAKKQQIRGEKDGSAGRKPCSQNKYYLDGYERGWYAPFTKEHFQQQKTERKTA